MLSPLSYEGGGCRIRGRKPGAVLGSAGWLVIRRGCAAGSGAGEAVCALDRVFGRAEVAVRFGFGYSGGERRGLSSPVLMESEAVDHERVADQVQELACVAEAVRTAKPE